MFMMNRPILRKFSRNLQVENKMSGKRFSRIVRISSVVAVSALLSGCGLPPAISIISYAFDGISMMSSGKSVSDHAISAVTDKDCALFRVVMGEEVCRAATADTATVVASVYGESTTAEDDTGEGAYLPGDGIAAPEISTDTLQATADGNGAFDNGTEFYAIVHDDGALEVFAHDPQQAEARDNLRLILKIDDYGENTKKFESLQLNGASYAITDLLV